MDDRVALSGLRLRGRHGVLPEERLDEQEFVVDVECGTDARAAARRDDVADALDYRRLAEAARAVIEGSSRALIETLAEDIAQAVLALGTPWVRVRLMKPRPGTIPAEAWVELRRPLPPVAAPVELHVPDFGPAKAFYGALGFRVMREEPARGTDGYLVLALGPTVLRFWPGTDEVRRHGYFGTFAEGTPRGYGVELVVVVDDLDRAFASAGAAGRIVAPPRSRPWGARDFRVLDPYGFYVRITEPHDPLASPAQPAPQAARSSRPTP